MSQSFFNTINFSGKDLENQNAKCLKQEDLILALFRANPDKKLSPSQVHSIFVKKYQIYPPITSIRRAITNLTGRMDLIKMSKEDMIPGPFSLPENTWKYAGATVTLHNFSVSNTGEITQNTQLGLFDTPPIVTTTWDSPIF